MPLMVSMNFSTMLFMFGWVGMIWNSSNLLLMLLCIELMFFSISLNFMFFSIYGSNLVGQVYALLMVTAVATETAVGLSLLMLAYGLETSMTYNTLITLRG